MSLTIDRRASDDIRGGIRLNTQKWSHQNLQGYKALRFRREFDSLWKGFEVFKYGDLSATDLINSSCRKRTTLSINELKYLNYRFSIFSCSKLCPRWSRSMSYRLHQCLFLVMLFFYIETCEYTRFSRDHTMCVKSRCRTEKAGLSSYDQKMILKGHNRWRSRLANGTIPSFPPAANMRYVNIIKNFRNIYHMNMWTI